MKTKLFFALLFFIAILNKVGAHGNRSEFHLSVFKNGLYTVMMDQQWVGYPGTTFKIHDLSPGRHRLRVLQVMDGHRTGGNRKQEVFDGFVIIPRSAEVHAFIDRKGVLHIADAYSLDYDVIGENAAQFQLLFPELPVNEIDFSNFYRVVERQAFESTRIELVEDYLRVHYVTTEQVNRLLGLCCFDSSRLEIAKTAYLRTVDRENFHLVYLAFTFDSSVRELAAYIVNVG